jgi:UDP-N-acetylmuramoyl-L-alanyl-D-glutamate--2,6-diaminopimelate ligase
MTISTLINSQKGIRLLQGDPSTGVRAITQDSRRVQAGDCFVAVRGVISDGHTYIGKALELGAVAIVCDEDFDWKNSGLALDGIVVLQAKDTATALGVMASAFHGHPAQKAKVIGVTGTNGKTSVTTLLWQCFTSFGYTCGLIGTVENRIGDRVVESTHTTPNAEAVFALLAEMVNDGCTYIFMEVSSHAIHQRRVAGLEFVGAVFTNLTHDHLDYHGNFKNYRDAKKMLFDDLPVSAFALTNNDDKNGAFMLQNTKAQQRTYGLKKSSDYKAKIIENALTGLHLMMDGEEVHARLIGSFNAYNLLAVYGVCRELGIEKEMALTAISGIQGAEGRFEYILHKGILGIVDYAHTPDALEQVLETIAKLKQPKAKVITVTGAGGDRDKTKRPIMAAVCAKLSDQLILTSDNPRTENPTDILNDMETGLDQAGHIKTLTIEKRETAIKTAVKLARSGDIILVAGKGHEKYQDIMGVKHPFDDKSVLGMCLTELV